MSTLEAEKCPKEQLPDEPTTDAKFCHYWNEVERNFHKATVLWLLQEGEVSLDRLFRVPSKQLEGYEPVQWLHNSSLSLEICCNLQLGDICAFLTENLKKHSGFSCWLL